MRGRVMAAVARICEDKRVAGIFPACASAIEITRAIREEAEAELMKLEEEGILKSHENFNKIKNYQV